MVEVDVEAGEGEHRRAQAKHRERACEPLPCVPLPEVFVVLAPQENDLVCRDRHVGLGQDVSQRVADELWRCLRDRFALGAVGAVAVDLERAGEPRLDPGVHTVDERSLADFVLNPRLEPGLCLDQHDVRHLHPRRLSGVTDGVHVDLVLAALVVGMLDLLEHAGVDEILERAVDRLVEQQEFVLGVNQAAELLELTICVDEPPCPLRLRGVLFGGGRGSVLSIRCRFSRTVGGCGRLGIRGRLRGDGHSLWWVGRQVGERVGRVRGELEPCLFDAAAKLLRSGDLRGTVLEAIAKTDDGRLVLGVHDADLGRGPLLRRPRGFRVGPLEGDPRDDPAGRHPAEAERKRLLPSSEHHEDHHRGREAEAETGEHGGLCDPLGEQHQKTVRRVDGSASAGSASVVIHVECHVRLSGRRPRRCVARADAGRYRHR